MQIHPDSIKPMIEQIAQSCRGEVFPGPGNEFVYDTVQKKVFSLKIAEHLHNFGVVSKRIPPVLRRSYFRWKRGRYRLIRLPVIPLDPDLIDLGPFFDTRGVQVKFYSIREQQVLCIGFRDKRTKKCAQNEADIYERYGGTLHIPRLITRIGPAAYIREYLKGESIEKPGARLLESLIMRLVEIYKSEGPQVRDAAGYVAELERALVGTVDSGVLEAVKTAILKCSGTVALVKSHGDFAAKNILVSRGEAYLIDWERSSRQSAFYDLCNFIFKLKPISQHELYSLLHNSQLFSRLAGRIEAELGVEPREDLVGRYALFLLERLALEKEIYVENPRRFEKFKELWLGHIEKAWKPSTAHLPAEGIGANDHKPEKVHVI